jgi:hypothetical protein
MHLLKVNEGKKTKNEEFFMFVKTLCWKARPVDWYPSWPPSFVTGQYVKRPYFDTLFS